VLLPSRQSCCCNLPSRLHPLLFFRSASENASDSQDLGFCCQLVTLTAAAIIASFSKSRPPVQLQHCPQPLSQPWLCRLASECSLDIRSGYVYHLSWRLPTCDIDRSLNALRSLSPSIHAPGPVLLGRFENDQSYGLRHCQYESKELSRCNVRLSRCHFPF
jgi:hypothetical protein